MVRLIIDLRVALSRGFITFYLPFKIVLTAATLWRCQAHYKSLQGETKEVSCRSFLIHLVPRKLSLFKYFFSWLTERRNCS